jgi:hypothetical protein
MKNPSADFCKRKEVHELNDIFANIDSERSKHMKSKKGKRDIEGKPKVMLPVVKQMV